MPLPRASVLAIATAAVLVLAPHLSAQRSFSQALIVEPGVGTSCTNDSGIAQLGSTSAICPLATIAGGQFSSSVTSDAALRRMSTVTSDTKVDGSVYGGAYSAAYSQLVNTMFVAGTAPAGANVVFHFLATLNSGLTNGGSSSTDNQLSINSSTGSGYYRNVGSSGGTFTTSSNATVTASGVDFLLSLAGFTGTYNYQAGAYSVSDIGNGALTGTIVYSDVDAWLTGIDAVDGAGQVIASASFAADGSATLNVSATPEPASLTLTATGLLAAFVVGRRRRGATR